MIETKILLQNFKFHDDDGNLYNFKEYDLLIGDSLVSFETVEKNYIIKIKTEKPIRVVWKTVPKFTVISEEENQKELHET